MTTDQKPVTLTNKERGLAASIICMLVDLSMHQRMKVLGAVLAVFLMKPEDAAS